MDEPFGALDAQRKLVLHQELLRLWTDAKTTIIFVTHDLSEAVTLSDRVGGRLVPAWHHPDRRHRANRATCSKYGSTSGSANSTKTFGPSCKETCSPAKRCDQPRHSHRPWLLVLDHA